MIHITFQAVFASFFRTATTVCTGNGCEGIDLNDLQGEMNRERDWSISEWNEKDCRRRGSSEE